MKTSALQNSSWVKLKVTAGNPDENQGKYGGETLREEVQLLPHGSRVIIPTPTNKPT